MKKTFLLLLFSMFASTIFAQRNCATMDVLSQQISADPDYIARMQAIESFTQDYILQQNLSKSAPVTVTIPVVFHVVYANSTQNISDAKIQAQINQLNLDFAKMNSDISSLPSAWTSTAANTNIQFCLAQRDASGNATTGIVRKSTTVSSFSSDDKVKYTAQGGDNAWPSTSYLNIWSCNLSGGLLGYAQFPGGAAATDGVVLLYSSIGSMTTPGTASPYNLGRTATHEVGHWLNLRHIWGDDSGSCTGSDLVSDTPNQADATSGCPSYPSTDACTASSPGIMFMNYMDYSNDACMYMFTNGQSTRMNALFASGGSRASLLTSLGCTAPSTATCATPTGMVSSGITTTGATISWSATTGATGYSLRYRVSGATTWTTVSLTASSYTFTGLTAGTSYEWQVATTCSSTSTSSYTASQYFTTTSSTTTTCAVPTGLTTSSITSTGATLSWTAVSGATSYNVQYKLASATTWTTVTSTTNSKTITGLTAGATYNWQVRTICSTTSASYSSAVTFTTTSATSTCSSTYESNNTSGTAYTISTNTNYSSQIQTSTDIDWYKFTTTSTAPKVKIDLSTLPADYDVKLYYLSGSTLYSAGSSANSGTTSEQIKYNTTTARTYYVKVYGYSSAYSASSCYTLKASVSSTSWKEMTEEEPENIVIENISDLVLAPNPASSEVSVMFDSAIEGTTQIKVYDIMGKEVYTQNLAVSTGSNKSALDVSNLVNGIYLVAINDGKKIYTSRVVVTH